jgi:hypothetical protein
MANDPTADDSTPPSHEQGEGEAATEDEVQLDGPAETPFDHPLFLPAILAGLWVWFGYDGFINQDPDMLEHLTFNRSGFAVLTLTTAWFGFKGWKELRERSTGGDDSSS